MSNAAKLRSMARGEAAFCGALTSTLVGGRGWWAHLLGHVEFTRVNTTPTILRKNVWSAPDPRLPHRSRTVRVDVSGL
jgi:hypothetical protein